MMTNDEGREIFPDFFDFLKRLCYHFRVDFKIMQGEADSEMISTIHSFCLRGISGLHTDVETYVTKGIPEFEIVGLGDASVKESKRRVIAALRNQGYEIPKGRITVNLAPSGVRKEGTSFDVAIAVGLLCALGVFTREQIQSFAFIGELSLDGSVRPVKGIMAMILEGRKHGITNYIIPKENCNEGGLIQGVCIFGAENLRQIPPILIGEKHALTNPVVMETEPETAQLCYSQVRGQQGAKRALEVAAAGGHHVLMLGTAGSGKTMLARRFPTILPPLSQEQMYETASIHSICGIVPSHALLRCTPPFREVDASITKAGLIGGRIPILPGEISLAHNGVLFWDEMAESDIHALDAIRVPLETGEIRIARAGQGEVFPARFQFIAASNPCRCGKLLEEGSCTCTPHQIERYFAKISKPLLERIDIHIPIRSLSLDEMILADQSVSSETSLQIQNRVIQTRQIQIERYKQEKIKENGQITRNMIEKYCPLTRDSKTLLSYSCRQMGFSMRTYEKVLRVSRTIADVNGHNLIEEEDISEAIQYKKYETGACA